MSTTMDTRYIAPAETARLLRQTLKREYPGVKFTVRTSTYSGGASIRVKWQDGPTESSVKGAAAPFEGAKFDAMIDLKHYRESWILPDGTAGLAYSAGTLGSHGSDPGYAYPVPEGAEVVHFGADFIFCERSIGEATARAVRDELAAKWGADFPQIREGWDGWSLDSDESWQWEREHHGMNVHRLWHDAVEV